MKTMIGITAWISAGVLALLALLLIFRGRFLLAIPIAMVAVLHLPIVPPRLPLLWTAVATVLLFALYVGIWFGTMGRQDSIFLSHAGRERVLAEYDRKLAEWEIPWESRYVETSFGLVHVVTAGDSAAPPIVLLHATSMGAWSWKPNVPSLVDNYRIYAVDLPGEAGRSTLSSLERPLFSDDDIALLYSELFDALGIETCTILGASAGGHQTMRIATLLPERVNRIGLFGPMGISNPVPSLVKMSLAILFPVAPMDALILPWALGTDPAVRTEADRWFRLVLRHVLGRPTPPRQLTEEELGRIAVPVLLVLAEADKLVGPAEIAAERARIGIVDCRIEILPGGHLVAMERSAEVNRLIGELLSP